MKHVVAGIGPDGRSTVLSTQEKVLQSSHDSGLDIDDEALRTSAEPEVRMMKLYDTAGAPPKVDRPATEPLLGVPLGPGETLWMDLSFDADTEYSFHRTDSIDYQLITSGEVELVLENGSVVLSAGDSVVVPGVKHRWRTTPGWTSTIFMIGLEPIT